MDTIRTARAAAVICIVGSAGAVVFSLALLAGFAPADESPYLLPIYVASLAGVAALALVGAAPGPTGRAGVVVAAVGLLGFVTAEILAPTPAGEALYTVVPLVTALGMVLAGIAVLRAGRWSGWRQYAPLALGLWILVMVVPVIVLVGDPGGGGMAAAAVAVIGAWHVLWVGLGTAVLVETGAGQHVPA
ncbi:MAG: hypothetical protein K0S40_115 [Actinomycetospora sp.]|jgi:hypothetical protein|nr:hypothetical protein [Actinomycetospora sp.]